VDIEAKLNELIALAQNEETLEAEFWRVIKYVKALESQLTPAQLHLAESGEWVAVTDKSDRKASVAPLFPFMLEPPQFNDRYLIEPCTHCKEWGYKDDLVKGLCKACREQLGTPPDER